MQMLAGIITITFACFVLMSQLSQASPLPGIEDKIKNDTISLNETKAVKETSEEAKALNEAKATDRTVFNNETSLRKPERISNDSANELSKLEREYAELKAYTSTQDTRIRELESKVKEINNSLSAQVRSRRSSNDVYCYDDYTRWDLRSYGSIMFLDRQHVYCPTPYFLSRFYLTRQHNNYDSKVRYNYRCCKVI